VAGELVLIVEDNEKNLKLARDVLQYHGFRIVEASTGRRGVELAREHCPDVVLLDIQLPDIDGVTALNEMRAEEGAADMPVVALTAFAMEADRRRLLEAGFNGYISKPINIHTFPLQIREFCALRAG
jgi:two-component system cell cycle response regulator DivK